MLKCRVKRLVQNVGKIGTTGQPVQTLWHHRLVLLGLEQQFEILFLQLSSIACPSNIRLCFLRAFPFISLIYADRLNNSFFDLTHAVRF